MTSEKYSEATHIQTAPEGKTFGAGKYKHQVMGKSGLWATIYTNDIEKAREWLEHDRKGWIEQDKIEAKKNKRA